MSPALGIDTLGDSLLRRDSAVLAAETAFVTAMAALERILGVEGGGTKTAWVLVERGVDDLRVIDQGRLPPSNFRLTPPDRLRSIFRQLPQKTDRVGMFLAGCGADDRHSLENLCAEIWPGARIVAGSDRDSGLAAALGHGDGIAVNAGTGATVTGRRGDRIEKAGGWGHILGDAGGGYFLSLQALRLILSRIRSASRRSAIHRQYSARALSLNSRDELVRWAQTADKMEIAMLCPVVFEAARNGDSNVVKIIEEGAEVLAEFTGAVASRLGLLAPKVILLGGVFQRDSLYVAAFQRRLKKNLSDARVGMSDQSPELGAAWLAAEFEERGAVSFETRKSEVESSGERAHRATESALGKSGNPQRAGIGRAFCRRRKIRSGSVAQRGQRSGARNRNRDKGVAQGWPPVLRRRRDQRAAGCARCERNSADVWRFAGTGTRHCGRRSERAPSQRRGSGRRTGWWSAGDRRTRCDRRGYRLRN